MRFMRVKASSGLRRGLVAPAWTVALLVAGSATQLGLRAQGPSANINGAVLDPAGLPIGGATISLAGTQLATTTDEKGHFRLSLPVSGPQKLAIKRLGFQPVLQSLGVVEGQSIRDVTIRMTPVAAMLNPVLVSASKVVYSGRLAGYYQRLERRSAGYFIDRETIDKKSYRNLSQLLRNVPGMNAFPLKTGGSTVRIRERQCRPLVWIDGVPMPAGEVDLDAFPVSTLHGIEVYSGSAATPQDFAIAGPTACGSIILWSRGRDTDPLPQRQREPMDLAAMIAAGKVFAADQVDQRASLVDSSLVSVTYPVELVANGLSGVVLIQYVVNEKGFIEPETISVVSSSHPLFSSAAALALKQASYKPAMKAGKAVRQVVLQPFNFVPYGSRNTSEISR
jgi:TonB family protein